MIKTEGIKTYYWAVHEKSCLTVNKFPEDKLYNDTEIF